VITGAGRGMGAATARLLASQGYQLALMSPSGSAETLAAELGAVGISGSTAEAAAKRKKIKPPKAMTTEYLKTPAAIELGEKIWRKQCQHCHGAKAYPGKAPKLKPRRYRPSFVWDRVTNGYRKMPRWDHVFSEEERMGLVANILSRSFSP
jgi:mono/diheme cytochrome c family protein